MRYYIKGGLLISPANNIEEEKTLLIEGDKISRIIDPELELAEDIPFIDAKGKWVVPGFIDLHVHFREPGQTYKEDIKTGTMAAAAGGFTTVCAMPNTNPVVDNPDTVVFIDDRGKKACGVNLLTLATITQGLNGEKLTDYKELIELPTRCKQMAGRAIAAISDDGKTVDDTLLMTRAMELARELNVPVFSHTEEEALAGGPINLGDKSKRMGVLGIPNEAEELIVARDILLAKLTGCKLHLCHISTRGSVDLIRLGKSWGANITAETAPHYFALTDETVMTKGGLAKMNPPLRSNEDKEAIILALRDGTIDAIATDHAPHASFEKEVALETAAFGIVGLETAFQIGYTKLVKEGLLKPSELIKKMSLNPAKILGIDRGVIATGKVADIAIIDVKKESIITPESFYSKGRNTPFGGEKVYGQIDTTIVDGRVIFNDRSFN